MIIEKTCIVCPVGCQLKIEEDSSQESGYSVSGNRCPRGKKYAITEMTNPTRVVTSTVKIKELENLMLPVKTTDGIPKDKVVEFMEEINKIEVSLPIKRGDILLENLYGTDVNLVATKTMN